MAERIRLTVVTPQRELLSREVDEATAPTTMGEIGVLPEHDFVFVELEPGEVAFRDGAEDGHFVVTGGFAEIGHDHMTILATGAEEAAEIDVARAVKSKEAAEKILARAETEEEFQEALARLQRAAARLYVGKLG